MGFVPRATVASTFLLRPSNQPCGMATDEGGGRLNRLHCKSHQACAIAKKSESMIEEIEIDGFRLLNGFKADLKGLNVVIGANAAGKSSLIDCLQLISHFCSFPFDKSFGQFGHPAYLLTANNETSELRWQISLCGLNPSNPANTLPENKPLVYEAVLRPDQQGRIQVKYEVLRFRDPAQGHDSPFKLMEATPQRRQVFDKRSRKLMPFDEADEADSSEAGKDGAANSVQNDRSFSQDSMQDMNSLLSQMQFRNKFPIPYKARLYLSSMSFYPGFDVTRGSSIRNKAAETSPHTWLTPQGDNLGTVLHELLTRFEFRTAASSLREYMHAAFPTFEDISCETTFGAPAQVLVRVREKHSFRPMEVWDLSDGMLRFLCLATVLLNPSPLPWIALDEPELGLHPRLLPIVADIIKEASERTQILVTTHSPDLLNCFEIDDIAVIARDENDLKSTWHRPSSREGLKRLLEDVMGDTLGDLHRSGELEAGA